MTPGLESAKKASDAGLRYITENIPGIRRIKHKNDFKYLGVDGKQIKDEKVLERLYNLVIPPAWKDVWISPQKNTHIQATGFDEKGRKQYIYHPEWTKLCQGNKFEKLSDFVIVLPKIRNRVSKDLLNRKPDYKKVLATVVWLLENTLIRIGNDQYAKENDHFGLTTLRNKHINLKSGSVRFEFKGKSGVMHSVDVDNPKVVKSIKACSELPGFELFQYVDEKGERHVIDSADVNEYLKETTSIDVSAKDFRTWGGTSLSALTLWQFGDFEILDNAKKNIKQAVKTVSKHLRNTPSVCRNYYIHPAVLSSYVGKKLIPHFESIGKSKILGLNKNEYRVLTLLKKYS